MENQIHRIGVLTSGGDAPGMNAAVRAVVRSASDCGIGCVGIRRGWNGLITSDFVPLDASSVSHIIDKGGTMLYTARSEEFMTEEGRDQGSGHLQAAGPGRHRGHRRRRHLPGRSGPVPAGGGRRIPP